MTDPNVDQATAVPQELAQGINSNIRQFRNAKAEGVTSDETINAGSPQEQQRDREIRQRAEELCNLEREEHIRSDRARSRVENTLMGCLVVLGSLAVVLGAIGMKPPRR